MQIATKKPITVQFVKYDGSNEDEVITFTEKTANDRKYYPCKPDIFLGSYDVNS